MEKGKIKLILLFAFILVAIGGITLTEKLNSNAASECEKLYFRIGENGEVVFNERIYTAQGMAIDGDTAYIAILKRPKVNGEVEQRMYFYKVENITSNSPKFIEPANYVKVGHANGMEYRNGDIIVAPSVGEDFKGVYKVGMEQEGDKIKYTVKNKYYIQTNSEYGVTDNSYARTIAYYKTVDGVDYYIVGIGQNKDKTKIKYMVGYLSEEEGKLIPVNGFKVEKPGKDDNLLNIAQDISCVEVNGRYKLVSTLQANQSMTFKDGYWPENTRNLALVTDVTNIDENERMIL